MRSVGRHLCGSVLPITLTAVALLCLATGPIMKSDDREKTQHVRGYSREGVWVEPYDR